MVERIRNDYVTDLRRHRLAMRVKRFSGVDNAALRDQSCDDLAGVTQRSDALPVQLDRIERVDRIELTKRIDDRSTTDDQIHLCGRKSIHEPIFNRSSEIRSQQQTAADLDDHF